MRMCKSMWGEGKWLLPLQTVATQTGLIRFYPQQHLLNAALFIVYSDDPSIEYGLTCTSGPLGGDAQIAALMCMDDLGALIFFQDPLSAHPHQADIDSLNRLANCGNIIVCSNPTSAMSMMHTLKCALEKGSRGMVR